MRRDPAPALRDMARAIERLRRFRGPDGAAPPLPEFSDERLLAERLIEIISEASRRLPDALKDQHPHLPWRDIAGIGNHLRHAYQRVDEQTVREVIEQHIDELDEAIRALSEQLP
jgi:uncharacterized protein with HEPN domain